MKHLKKFNEMQNTQPKTMLYNVDLNSILPEYLTIQEYGVHTFKRGNIMKNADMFQITYFNAKNEWAYTDTLEIDLYTVQDCYTENIRIDVDITLGDFVVSEFRLECPNKISVIQHMTYGTKFCKDCPIFAFTDESIQKLVSFFNHINGIKLTEYDLRFLNNKDDWKQDNKQQTIKDNLPEYTQGFGSGSWTK